MPAMTADEQTVYQQIYNQAYLDALAHGKSNIEAVNEANKAVVYAQQGIPYDPYGTYDPTFYGPQQTPEEKYSAWGAFTNRAVNAATAGTIAAVSEQTGMQYNPATGNWIQPVGTASSGSKLPIAIVLGAVGVGVLVLLLLKRSR